MDGRRFDELVRGTSQAATRRGALGLLIGSALTAVGAYGELALAKRKRKGKGNTKKNKGCQQLNQGCGGKKRCCNGLICTGGVCSCPSGFVPSGTACIPAPSGPPAPPPPPSPPPPPPPPPPPECVDDNDCGANEICQNASCVPGPECDSDNDCGDNEECQSGSCICPEVLEDRCVVRCSGSSDCPDGCLCRGVFPGSGLPRVVCVSEIGNICSTPSCTTSEQCDSNEICVHTTCGSQGVSGRCFQVCVG